MELLLACIDTELVGLQVLEYQSVGNYKGRTVVISVDHCHNVCVSVALSACLAINSFTTSPNIVSTFHPRELFHISKKFHLILNCSPALHVWNSASGWIEVLNNKTSNDRIFGSMHNNQKTCIEIKSPTRTSLLKVFETLALQGKKVISKFHFFAETFHFLAFSLENLLFLVQF